MTRPATLFDPRLVLIELLRGSTTLYLATFVADLLLDEEKVYRSKLLPRGFTLQVSVFPIPEPVVINGATPVKGQAYDVVYAQAYGANRGKMKTLHGWEYVNGTAGSDWIPARAIFMRRKGQWGGRSQTLDIKSIVSLTEVST